MGFSPLEIDRVRRFWNAPRMAQREGLKAVQMFDAIARGEIKALWVMATNPAVSLPDAGAVREALGKLELFVVSENVLANDTVASGAHILLPAAAWGEKRRHRHQFRAAHLAPAHVSCRCRAKRRPDWWIVCAGGAAAWDLARPSPIGRRRTCSASMPRCRPSRMTAARDFDIGAFADVSESEFDTLAPFQWPRAKAEAAGETRFFAKGGFFTPDRKARFIAPERPALAATQTARIFRSRSIPGASATSGTP